LEHATLDEVLDWLRAKLTEEEVPVTRAQAIATEFAHMADEGQADFFEHVARIFKSWDDRPDGHGGYGQQLSITRHMATCECVTEVGREWVHELSRALLYQQKRASEESP
jgi:hypothetical protein